MKTTSSMDSLPLTKMSVNFHSVFYAVRFYPGCMKLTFLKRHLNGCHPNHKSKGTAFFKQKEDELKRARLDCSGYISQQNKAGLRASCMVILRIVREKNLTTLQRN